MARRFRLQAIGGKNNVTKSELDLVRLLKPLLWERDFKWIARRHAFIRKEPHGFSGLIWSAWPTSKEGGRLEISPLLQVRHDKVDDVVNQLELIYGEENKRYTVTVSRPLGFFPIRAGKNYELYIRDNAVEADVEVACRSLVDLVDQEGAEFFSRYASVLECSLGLNEPVTSNSHALFNNFPLRAYYGITAASFAQPDRVLGLVRDYRAFAKVSAPSQFEQISKKIDELMAILKIDTRA
jgi:hypothetical protein